MFARLLSQPVRPLITRGAMIVAAIAGLCVLADQGARRLKPGGSDRAGPREARVVADPATTGSLRPASPGPALARPSTPSSDGLDRRGLSMLVSSGAVNAVAAPGPAKRKPEATAAARPR